LKARKKKGGKEEERVEENRKIDDVEDDDKKEEDEDEDDGGAAMDARTMIDLKCGHKVDGGESESEHQSLSVNDDLKSILTSRCIT
jgi:hypothetical protein